MQIYGKHMNKETLKTYVGDLSQVMGIRSYTLDEGNAKGTKAFDIRTGSGLAFTVLPDRAMDIAWMEYKGIPLSYITKAGIVSPGRYQAGGMEWMRSFFAGMLTTCGLTHVGAPRRRGDYELGMHGRIANMSAYEVGSRCRWSQDGEELIFTVEGKCREAVIYEENMVMHRTIAAHAGESRFVITDVVENCGCAPAPFMMLYHMNFGFPLLDENSRIMLDSRDITPVTQDSCVETCRQLLPPQPEHGEVFVHDLKADEQGWCKATLLNERLGIAATIRFEKERLPYLVEWKNMCAQDYVLGLEPASYDPRLPYEKQMQMLAPGEQAVIRLEVSVEELAGR